MDDELRQKHEEMKQEQTRGSGFFTPQQGKIYDKNMSRDADNQKHLEDLISLLESQGKTTKSHKDLFLLHLRKIIGSSGANKGEQISSELFDIRFQEGKNSAGNQVVIADLLYYAFNGHDNDELFDLSMTCCVATFPNVTLKKSEVPKFKEGAEALIRGAMA